MASKYGIDAVPSYIFLKNGVVTDRVLGANAPVLTKTVGVHAAAAAKQQAAAPDAPAPTPSAGPGVSLESRLKQLITQAPVMLFMKGTPDAPRCGFSKRMVELLKENKIRFGSFDILEDNQVREGLKVYSDWPTFPQLYVNAQLIGGLDIAVEMAGNGELLKEIPASELIGSGQGTLEQKLKSLINQHKVMLFMKGNPEAPRCGFSSKAVAMLKSQHVPFGSFDILTDETVRAGLKEYSNWPTYPQLYVDGELVGGVDIMAELLAAGELAATLAGSK
eukprot:TRINITY_DN183_c0_g1_i1.p1 TRINITY_DN183_c0_g1~~TRINITY_DN183_c0_g1_i1.p1  ORF type:complete len:277 (-),score=66.37 TRINITY_DN183_c0_g1_i1:37-867(-)